MGAPGDQRRIIGVVVEIIVLRQIHIITDALVATVFRIKGIRCILQMTCDIELTTCSGHHDTHTTIWRLCNQGQILICQDILTMDLRMTAMRHHKHIIETTEDRQSFLQRILREDAEHLLLQRIFGNTIMIIQACLSRPADIKRTGDMGTGPIEDIGNLIPVVHLFKIKRLYRCTCDDHTIKLLIAHRFEVAVEHHHVFDRRILGGMTTQFHETDLQLQGGVRKETDQVRLSCNL